MVGQRLVYLVGLRCSVKRIPLLLAMNSLVVFPCTLEGAGRFAHLGICRVYVNGEGLPLCFVFAVLTASEGGQRHRPKSSWFVRKG